MAVTVWSSTAARLAQACRRASGIEVSIAVWGQNVGPGVPVAYSLRFKQSLDGGATWPPDEAAVVIARLARREPWFIVEAGPALVVGNGLNRQFRTLRSGEAAGDWQEST